MTDPRFYRGNQFIQDRWIECARWNNLVYARTLKCGSEFFYRNFTQTADWQPISWDDIDWRCDIVFSYVMDPIARRHKGIAEFIVAINARDALFRIPEFGQTISQVPCLDEHSACLRDIYGDRLEDMHWIPLSQIDHAQGQILTDKFLDQHGHPPISWNKEFVHTTDNYMGDIHRRVRELWENEKYISGFVRSYFQQDIELYHRALSEHGLGYI